MSPVPTTTHQWISQSLNRILADHFMPSGRGMVFFAPLDVITAEGTVLQPDLMVLLRENRDRLTKRAIEGPPDLVVEITSPGTIERDRVTKARLYASAGVPTDWLLFPDTREVVEHRLTDGQYNVSSQAHAPVIFESAAHPGLSVDIDGLFAMPS